MQKYFYHEYLADYAEMKEKGLMSRGELYGDPDFSHFASKAFRPRRFLDWKCLRGPAF